MTTSELVALGMAIEAVEKPKAEQRIREGSDRARAIQHGKLGPADVGGAQNKGEVRQKVAKALGMGRTRYAQAKHLVQAADAGDQRAVKAAKRSWPACRRFPRV